MTNSPTLRGFDGKSSSTFKRATGAPTMVAGIGEFHATIRTDNSARSRLSRQAIAMSLRNVSTAAATMTGTMPKVGVRNGKGMTVFAMGCARMSRRGTIAAPIVFSSSHRFKMIGIHATRIAAEVIQFEPIWNRSDKHSECKSPSDPHLALEIEASVTASLGPNPFPALGWIGALAHYLMPKSLHRIHAYNLTTKEVK